MPAATVTTGAKPHGRQQLARDLEVERAVMGYAASGKVGLVSVHLSRIQRLLQAVMNLSQLAESDARREEAQLRVRHHAALAWLGCRKRLGL